MTTSTENTPLKKFGLPNALLILGLSILLCGEAYFGYRVQSVSREQEHIKEDYSTINNITFGLFSVDQWRDKIAAIINKQVHDFNVTPAQKKQLQAQVEQQLHDLVTKMVNTINKPQHTLSGELKKYALNKFVDVDKIQDQVPSFARTIVNKVTSPASQHRLKDIAGSKIVELEKQTYDSTETTTIAVTNYMYRKYHVANAVDFTKDINTRLAHIRQVTYNYSYAMLGCVLFALALWWLMRKQVHLQTTLFIMSLLFALVVLTVGITASIIEVDARIKTLNFMLLGEKVAFENQVLFFQSKSILQIITVLIKQSKPDAVMVGSLILLFVVLLPIIRMIARGIHIVSSETFAKNRALRYLAFQAGKWDMADVMVVGILMTYIGLNGILQSQLSNLNIHNSFLTTVTENSTSLQPGYVIFAGYVVFNILLTAILKRITPEDAHQAGS